MWRITAEVPYCAASGLFCNQSVDCVAAFVVFGLRAATPREHETHLHLQKLPVLAERQIALTGTGANVPHIYSEAVQELVACNEEIWGVLNSMCIWRR